MQLTHSVVVPRGPSEVFAVLTDLTRLAPGLPDATLEVVAPDRLAGSVPLQLGVLPDDYAGSAELEDSDADAGTVTIEAQAREQRGDGSIRGTIHVQLLEHEGATRAEVTTDLVLRGGPAEVSRKSLMSLGDQLLQDLAERVAEVIDEQPAGAAAALDQPLPVEAPRKAVQEEEPTPEEPAAPELGVVSGDGGGTPGRSTDGRGGSTQLGELDLLETVASVTGRDPRELAEVGRVVRRATSSVRRPVSEAVAAEDRRELARRMAPAALAALLVLLVWWRSR